MARRTPPTPTSTCRLVVQRATCTACGAALHVAHHAHRTIRRLDGIWRLTMPLMRCLNRHCASFRTLCRPEEEGAWALPHGEFGFDVIALVGQLRYAQHRSLPEIYQELHTRGVVIAERTVTNLLARYEELVALRLTDADALRHRFHPQGQIILGIDGLKPDVGHEVLWVLRDCLSGEVLLARSLLSEAEEELVALLREVQALAPVPITGVISDGQTGLRHAVAKALPNIPHQLCQYHYLREAVKPLYEADRHAKKDLKALVRDIRPVERLMEGVLAHQPEITPAYMRRLSEEEARIVQDYCLAVRSALTDDGQPPLWAAGLRLQERLTKISASLQQAMLKGGIIGASPTHLSASNVRSSAV
ncbi:MAG TPA: transposase [Ktedonobacterales bacterium]|nr:transposase [Ktedonobacterales bacterium]